MSFSVNFQRVIKYGLINLWRYRLLSITAVVITVISLLVISSLLVLNQLALISSQNLKDRVDISIFFNPDVTSGKIEEVQGEFSKYEEVKSTKYITAEQALEDFKNRHSDDPLIQKTLNELKENPLEASLVVSAKDLNLYPLIIQKIDRSRFQPLIKKVNYEDSRNLIQTLQKITTGIRNFGILLAVVFGLISVLVMFNTLRLTIFSRREEIEIMKLVGASNWYVRGPYLVEGVMYGLAGTVISTAILYPILRIGSGTIRTFFGIDLKSGTYFNSDFWQLILIQLAVGISLGIISSIIATKKHLRV